jgi:RNA polymerase sigma factor (sigma-70 family)
MPGDSELLRQYAQGRSEAAFAELVRRHVDFVYGVALRHARTAHRAEDATQAVFTDLAHKAREVAHRTEIVGWLYTSARYAAYKIVRSEVRREKREQEAEMIQGRSASPRPEADWREIQPLLDDALNGLGEKDRSAVLLRCVKNLSFAEVGAAVELSEEAARKRVDRALDRLRAQLTRRGVASTAAALALALTEQGAMAAPSSLAASVSSAAIAAGNATPLLTGLIQIMSTSKIVAGAAVIAGAVAFTAALHETRRELQAEGQQAAASRDYDQLRDRLALARQRNQADEKAWAGQASVSARGAAGGVSAESPEAETAAGKKGASGRLAAGAPPTSDSAKAEALRRVGRDYIKAGTRMSILAAGKFLKTPLTPDQIDALVEIQASDFNVVVNGVAVPGNPPEDEAKGIRQIVALVGLNEARELGAQHRAAPYQQMTSELAGDLVSDEPLASQTATQLTAILQKNQVYTQPDGWMEAIAAAANVLSPSQTAVLRTYASSKTGIDYTNSTAP